MKRLTAMLLVLCMLFSMVPAAAAVSGETALSRTGWTATASSQFNSAGPQQMIDDASKTNYTSGHQGRSGDWFRIDLGAVRTISSVEMDWLRVTNGYKLEISQNGTDWTLLSQQNGHPGGTQHYPAASPVDVRYLRCTVTDTWSEYLSVEDVRIYTPEKEEPKPQPQPQRGEQLSRVGWTADSNSEYSAGLAQKVLDGDPTTRYLSAAKPAGKYLTVTAPEAVTLSGMDIDWLYWADSHDRDVEQAEIQAADDAGAFRTIYTLENVDESARNAITFSEPVTCSKIRIVFCQMYGNGSYAGIQEVNFYGVPEQKPSQLVQTQAVEQQPVSPKPQPHLWETAPTLWQAAQGETFETELNPDKWATRQMYKLAEFSRIETDYQGLWLCGADMKADLWGVPEELTFGMRKTDVWDRRYDHTYFCPTFDDIITGAMQDHGSVPTSTRGSHHFYKADGTKVNGTISTNPFNQVTVGQMLLHLPDFAHSQGSTRAVTDYDSGLTTVQLQQGTAKATAQYLVTMEENSNIMAAQVAYENLTQPLSVELYRRNSDGFAKPESGYDQDGFFWIKQQLPEERTFPNGFTYYLVGLTDQSCTMQTHSDEKYLGRELANTVEQIRGSNAEATVGSGTGTATVYWTVVTTAEAQRANRDGQELEMAKEKLTAAKSGGFAKLVADNRSWYEAFYNRREQGRMFDGTKDRTEKSLSEVFGSWVFAHGQSSNPNPREYECDGWNAGSPDQDGGGWHSSPTWNEAYFSQFIVQNRSDMLRYYQELPTMWLEAGKGNAKRLFGLDGWVMSHGYVPPTLPPTYEEVQENGANYPHDSLELEFSVETAVNCVKHTWDVWDYGGDETYLEKKVYPVISQLAIFYDGYARKCTERLKNLFPDDSLYRDGNFHLIGCSSEHHGWTPQLAQNIDSTGAIAAIRWTMNKALEATELLTEQYGETVVSQKWGITADHIKNWTEIREHLPAYPTWEAPKGQGTVITDMRGVDPFQYPLDNDRGYNTFNGVYPTLIGEDINLDSAPEDIALMMRTVDLVGGGDLHQSCWMSPIVPHLLGQDKDYLRHGAPTYDWWVEMEPDLLNTPDRIWQAMQEQPERLLNSRSGRIHLFPCVPDGVTIGFREMQAKGGFLVTAEKRDGVTTYVSVTARRTVPCEIVNPFGAGVPAEVFSGGSQVIVETTEDSIRFAAEKGKTYEIRRAEPENKLVGITFNGTPIPGFDPKVLHYDVTCSLAPEDARFVVQYPAGSQVTVEESADSFTAKIGSTVYTVHHSIRQPGQFQLVPRRYPFFTDATNWNSNLLVMSESRVLAKLLTADGLPVYPNETLQYHSTDPTVAVVDQNGLVTLLGKGTADIYATMTIDGTERTTNSITYTVKEGWSAALSCGQSMIAGSEGRVLLDGKTLNTHFAHIETTYESSNPQVAEVYPDGTVRALKPGDAEITVTVTRPGGSTKKVISVNVIQSCTVTLQCGEGSSPASVTVKQGQALDRPIPPVRDGYRFTGWYQEEACQTLWDFKMSITQDCTLYAGWEPAQLEQLPKEGWSADATTAFNNLGAEKAYDGKITDVNDWNCYASNSEFNADGTPKEPMYYTLNLGTSQTLGQLEIIWHGGWPAKVMTVSVSEDGTTWTPVVENQPVSPIYIGEDQTENRSRTLVELGNLQGQYVKIEALKGNGRLGIVELNVGTYQKVEPAPAATVTAWKDNVLSFTVSNWELAEKLLIARYDEGRMTALVQPETFGATNEVTMDGTGSEVRIFLLDGSGKPLAPLVSAMEK